MIDTQMQCSKIQFEERVYPRRHKDSKTISAYVQSLEAGAEFPPILIQRVINDGAQYAIVLDGAHRIEAYREIKRKDIAVRYYKDEALDLNDNWIELRLVSAQANSHHGLRGSNEDNKETARIIAENDPKKKYTESMVAKSLGVTQPTVHNWIYDIRARQSASRNNLIYRLNGLGWTQEEIANIDGRNQPAIAGIIKNINYDKIDNSLKAGKSIEEVAAFEGLDLTLTWALALEGKTDEERMESLGEDIRKFTVWNYSDANDLMGHSAFHGRMPGQITLNTLYWFTKPGDLVIDPMSGSGTTIDACLLMGRKCYGYDKNPFKERQDILKNDITQGFPNKKPDFIFVNPPYWTMIDYNDEGISIEDFYHLLDCLAKESYEALPEKGRIAVLMGNQSAQSFLPEGVNRLDHVDKEREYFLKAGFEKEWSIQCPMPTQGANRWAQKEWDNHRLAEITRELTIWKK